jgi:hypothetical protein
MQRSCHGNKKILAHPAGQRKTKKKAANEETQRAPRKKGLKAAATFTESPEQEMEIKWNGK